MCLNWTPVDSDAFPSGLGEPPFRFVAPAIGNKILPRDSGSEIYRSDWSEGAPHPFVRKVASA